jgi:UPF0755 protein
MKKRFVLLSATVMLAGAGWLVWDLLRPYQGFSGSQILILDPGTKAGQAADLLVESGVLAHRWPFLACYWLGRPRRTIKAGEYLFDRPLRPLDVYRKLIHGDVYLHVVLIPEGSDRFDIARILHEQLDVAPQDFLRSSQEVEALRDLDSQATTLEGYLFPDTYRFPRGVRSDTVIAAMLAQFRHVLAARILPEGQPLPEKLREVITLASLVEKETPAADERTVIAGVFQKRLEKRMPLQCDPTVVYAARLSGRPIGPITQTDLQFDSPYNTYRYAGLPPGPIANPGEASIRAALQPASTPFLYFVSNNQGRHIFARTLAEHQRNVARYRREVAALRRATSGQGYRPDSGYSPRRRNHVTSSSSEGAENPEQETAHPRALPGKGSGARRGTGNTRSAGGAAPTPRS